VLRHVLQSQVVSAWLAQYLPFKIISKSSLDLLAEVCGGLNESWAAESGPC
jgi:hypothetical protein